jgi:ssDNA-binding Zn-finger/Zn-ribbon topoisomerase 1
LKLPLKNLLQFKKNTNFFQELKMICPVCGSELREDAKFCNVCGFEIGIENQINIREIRQKITKFRLPNFVEEVEPTWRDCPLCGKPVVKSIGEYGEFCACATYPICKFACDEDELDELTNSPLPDCPICKDGKILPRKGRYGKFYGCSNYPQCNFTVPEDDLDKLDSMEIKRCPNCGGYKDYHAELCIKCSLIKRRKVDRPCKEDLLKLIINKTFVEIGKIYGVSDNAIRKWCKYYDLPYKKEDIKKILY